MSSIEAIRKEHATRVMNELELAYARRTQECLVATCIKRTVFQMKHGRAPTPEECSKNCPYHPEFKSYNSDVRFSSRRFYYE